MIGRYDLIELLSKYNINGEKLIGKNANVLDYGEYKEIEEIIKFLLSKGFTPSMIEKCPSIIYWTNSKNIRDNYNWLIDETEITFYDISGCLYVLGSNLDELKKIYSYVKDKYGIETIKKCISILNDGDYFNIVSLTETLESTVGLDIVKDNGGFILYNTSSEEFKKILTIPEFKYNQNTKEYNKELLTATTFKRTYDEIKEILELPQWKEAKYQPLLTPNVCGKDAGQIKAILELPQWKEAKYQPLLTSSVWSKNAIQIKEILELPQWKETKYQPLLTPNVWNKDASQIKEILELPQWQETKYQPLLTSSVWNKDASQIKEILGLSYWQEKKYQSLLTPTIWIKTAEQIIRHIEFCESDEELKEFSNNPTLVYRISINELIAKTNYLRANNMPVVVGDRINSIYGMSNKNMQKRYGISKKEIVRDYLNININISKRKK